LRHGSEVDIELLKVLDKIDLRVRSAVRGRASLADEWPPSIGPAGVFSRALPIDMLMHSGHRASRAATTLGSTPIA
jgi:hypothetical protein